MGRDRRHTDKPFEVDMMDDAPIKRYYDRFYYSEDDTEDYVIEDPQENVKSKIELYLKKHIQERRSKKIVDDIFDFLFKSLELKDILSLDFLVEIKELVNQYDFHQFRFKELLANIITKAITLVEYDEFIALFGTTVEIHTDAHEINKQLKKNAICVWDDKVEIVRGKIYLKQENEVLRFKCLDPQGKVYTGIISKLRYYDVSKKFDISELKENYGAISEILLIAGIPTVE